MEVESSDEVGESCKFCEYVFESKEILNQHIKEKHSKFNYQCVCKQWFRYKVNLERHYKASCRAARSKPKADSKKQNLKCEHCNKIFKSKKALLEHLEYLEKNEPISMSLFKDSRFQCHSCDQCFDSKRKLDTHIRNCHSWNCIRCSAVMKTEAQLVEHLASEHSITKNITCLKCSIILTTKKLLDEHLLEQHSIECDQCGEKFLYEKFLILHMAEKHKESGIPKCQICNQIFAKKENLRIHIAKLHTFECDQCEEVFQQRNSLFQHISEKHAKLKAMVCTICKPHVRCTSQEFWYKHYIQFHSIECKQCNEVFETNNLLITHLAKEHNMIKTDLSSNRRKCMNCPEVFSTEQDLEIHSKVHIKLEKLQKLETCEKDNISHERHAVNDNGMTSNYCPKCPEVFSTEEDLEKHSKVHIKLEDFHEMGTFEKDTKDLTKAAARSSRNCPNCPEVFRTEEDLEKHSKVHIPNKESSS